MTEHLDCLDILAYRNYQEGGSRSGGLVEHNQGVFDLGPFGYVKITTTLPNGNVRGLAKVNPGTQVETPKRNFVGTVDSTLAQLDPERHAKPFYRYPFVLEVGDSITFRKNGESVSLTNNRVNQNLQIVKN